MPPSNRVDEILAMSPEERRKLNLRAWKKRSKSRVSSPRPKWDEGYLLDFLRDNGFDSASKLNKGRSDSDPNLYDYRKVFGSWSSARDKVFPKRKDVWEDIDVEYLAKTVVEFELWTRDDYRQARKLRPDVFPSEGQIIKHFKTYSDFRSLCKQMSGHKTMTDYLRLVKRKKKKPSVKECRENFVNIDLLIDLWGSKSELDRFLKL